MSFTSHSDFYIAIQDAGIDRAVKHVMRQRPCWFNYGSEGVYDNRELLCEKLDISPRVRDEFDHEFNNPNPKILDFRWRVQRPEGLGLEHKDYGFELPFWALPIFNPLGSGLFLDFCLQVSKVEIDFHPENIITLPQQLNPPLNNQRFAFHVTVCAGIACPSDGELRAVIDEPTEAQQIVPTKNMNCFCVNAYLVGGVSIIPSPPNPNINFPHEVSAKLDVISIPEMMPLPMQKAIECYARLVLDVFMVPQLNELVKSNIEKPIELGKDKSGESYGSIKLSLPSVPNNPSIEDDQLKAFINLDDIVLNLKFSPEPSDKNPNSSPRPGTGGPPTPPPNRIRKQRTRTGNFDLTTAISASAISKIFQAFVKGFKFIWNDEGRWARYLMYKYSIEAHLEGGQITLQDDGSVKVSNLGIKFDKLEFEAGIDLPRICIQVPPEIVELCFFGDNPDIGFRVNLRKYLSIKIEDFTARFDVFYLDGTQGGVQSKWELYLNPDKVHVGIEIINKEELKKEVEGLIIDKITEIMPGPGPVNKLLMSALKELLGEFHSLEDMVLNKLLHIESFADWFLNLLNTKAFIQYWEESLAEYLLGKQPIFERDDPTVLLQSSYVSYLGKHDPYQPGERDGGSRERIPRASFKLIPVMMPIEYTNVRINSNEVVLEADIADNY